jgi:hypothetical protein
VAIGENKSAMQPPSGSLKQIDSKAEIEIRQIEQKSAYSIK